MILLKVCGIMWRSSLIPDPMPTKVLAALTRLARLWGGDILPCTPEEFEVYASRADFEDAPFISGAGLGVLFKEKLVLYVPGAKDVNWSGITHEMGHVFASKEGPQEANEGSFLGWEYRLARLVGTQKEWLALNQEYWMNSGETIGGLLKSNPKQLRAELKANVAESKRLGLLDADLNPIAIR